MVDPGSIGFLAPVLAAVSAAAFIFTFFYPLIVRPPLSNRRSAVFETLLKGGRAENIIPATRSVRRAQEAALKSVTQRSKAGRMSRLEKQLAAAGLRISVQRYLTICSMMTAVLFSIAKLAGFAMPASAVGAALLGWFLPQRYLMLRAARRRQAFLRAFSPAVDTIIRGAKSGLSLMDCLAMVASDAADPVRQEFEVIVAQLRAGVSLPAAMEKLAAVMPAPEVRFFVMVMSAQSQAGGNLTDALANLSGVLRDRDKIATKIRISSAEGRMSALIIGALPFLVIGITAVVAPGYISYLWTDETGRRIGIFCAFWLICGVFVLSRMARIEV